MSDVVISYARSTATQARAVAAALRSLGYDVWLDDELPAHRAYRKVIQEQVTAAKAVLVLWSSDAIDSDWVPSEAERARTARKLVQVAVDDTELPMPFDQIQCADLRGWTGDLDAPGWRKVIASIAELVGEDRSAYAAATALAGAARSNAGATSSRRRILWAALVVVAAIAAAATWYAMTRAPDRSIAARSEATPTDTDAAKTATAFSDRPAIAVLPFENHSDDPKHAVFADGLAEDLITRLSAWRSFPVIGRGSSFHYRGDVDVKQVAKELGVRYVVQGSVRRVADRIRVTAQLIEAG